MLLTVEVNIILSRLVAPADQGGGDQSVCGGLLTRPRPDHEDLRSYIPGQAVRAGGEEGVHPAGGHQLPGARHGDVDQQSRQ